MTLKSFKLTLTLLSVLIFSSCKQEGCTDKNAVNYSADADKDDGTCKFEGKIVFWYNQTAATYLINNGSTSLTFYCDGAIVGSTSTSVYWTGAPDCGSNASITVTKDLGFSKTKSYSYSVIDDLGNVIWGGEVSLDANTCLAFQLTV